jgi:hypothetical protein
MGGRAAAAAGRCSAPVAGSPRMRPARGRGKSPTRPSVVPELVGRAGQHPQRVPGLRPTRGRGKSLPKIRGGGTSLRISWETRKKGAMLRLGLGGVSGGGAGRGRRGGCGVVVLLGLRSLGVGCEGQLDEKLPRVAQSEPEQADDDGRDSIL